jgi:excisionase family DNA binding protein
MKEAEHMGSFISIRLSQTEILSRHRGGHCSWSARSIRQISNPSQNPESMERHQAPVELLTIKEAAAFLKISVPTMQRLQSDRYISFIKVGGSVRFAKSDILEYLMKRRVSALH